MAVMEIGSIILGGLKVANLLLESAKEAKLLRAGEDAAIARGAAELFKRTEHAKIIHGRIESMDEEQVDVLLARLAAGDVPAPGSAAKP